MKFAGNPRPYCCTGVKSGGGCKAGVQSCGFERAGAQAAEVEETREVQFEDRLRNANESDVAAEFEVVVAVNNVHVVSELVTCFRAQHRREEFAADESGARDIESNRVAVLRFESRAAFAEVETRFVNDVV